MSMLAVAWTLVAVIIAGMVGIFDMLRSEIGGLSDRVHELAERQAEMTGQLVVLRDMAHTH